jgi:hypothetical protein
MQAGERGAGCFDCLRASESCTVVEHVRLGNQFATGEHVRNDVLHR